MPQMIAELEDIGITAISEAEPCGISAKYEDQYQTLESEIGKIQSLSSNTVDWHRVLDLSSEILKNQSKDILVGAYLAVSMLRIEGMSGLATGLKVVSDLVKNYWEGLYPPIKRLRARSNAMQWLSEQAEACLVDLNVTQDNAADILSASSQLTDLLDELEQKYDSDAPGMLELHKRLKDAKTAAKSFVNEAPANNTSATTDKTIETSTHANDAAPVTQVSQNKTEDISSQSTTPPSEESVENAKPESVVLGHPYADIGSTPIPGESACGIAVKYEESFERLEAELAKQESLTSAAIDWALVKSLASEILKNQSKDLLVAAYLSKALLETEGYRGLAVALTILRDIIKVYWKDLFPPLKRMRARESALQWMSEKSGLYFAAAPPSSKDNQCVIECASILSDIFDLLDENIEGGSPGLVELSRPLKEAKKAAEHDIKNAQKAAPSSTPASTQTPPESNVAKKEDNPPEKAKETQSAKPVQEQKLARASSSKPMPNLDGAVASENEAKKALRAIQEAARKVGGYHLESALSDPKSYRINRVSTWMMIDTCPLAKDGITQLPAAPVDTKKQQLQALFDGGNYEELLPQLEQSLTRAPFWFDGQHMTARVLQALGADYAEALDMVIRELRNFLSRVPGLEMLKFSDGTPFANVETLQWLDEAVFITQNDNAEGMGEAPWQDIRDEAKALIVGGKISEGAALFESGIDSAPSERLNWQWRFALAQLLTQVGKVALSLPILRSLLSELVSSNLLKWDALLGKNVALLLYKSAKTLAEENKEDPTLLDAQNFAYHQLCLIDPITALTVQEK